MSRLRHPVHAIREPFGKAGLTVAILALVLAMVGGAWAAGGLSGKQKKEVKAIAKSFQGTGAAGTAGAAGANGKDGTNGTNGTPGTSATTETFAGSAHAPCTEGGVVVKSASPEAIVCNGKKGTTGFTEFLPTGKSEKGVWAISGYTPAADERVFTAVSFVIPLSSAPTTVHYLTSHQKELAINETTGELEEVTPTAGCPGTALEPAAEKGNLCVFGREEDNTAYELAPGGGVLPVPLIEPLNEQTNYNNGSYFKEDGEAGPYGFGVTTFSENAGLVDLAGSWAVTAN